MELKRKNTVLIIDDETANIIALTNILSPEYDVLASKSGLDAISLAEEHSPDVVLLDVLMPEMDGYEVIAALKNLESTRKIPVIFITGLDSAASERKGLALGAADYIPKPFNAEIVKLRVQIQIKLVNHIRALEERDEMERQLNKIKELEAGLIAAKEQAEHSRELAEHSSRAKSEFLSRMSHEMRTPMNSIIGMLQVIKMRTVPESISDFINEIGAASNHLLGIIDDVLDVSGMEYGAFKLTNTLFNINALFEDVISTTEYNATLKNQTMHSDIDHDIPIFVVGDEKRLKQVVSNLLANAIKFTPDLGNIYLSAKLLEKKDGNITLQVEVADDGIGISEEQQKGLFTIFDQADGSNTRKHGGIGLGLALSKRIVEMMGGTITIESQPDKGAKFIFTAVLQEQSKNNTL